MAAGRGGRCLAGPGGAPWLPLWLCLLLLMAGPLQAQGRGLSECATGALGVVRVAAAEEDPGPSAVR
jgi:hypothetical protein